MNYGKSILNLWNLDRDITFLNNGSFGATPKSVLKAQREYSDFMEKNPVSFIVDHSKTLLNTSIEKLSSLVNANPQNITFIENATTAVNSVLHFLIFQKKLKGEILYSNHTYPAVINTLKYYEEFSDITLKLVDIPYPVSNDEIISIFQNAISADSKFAVIDSISSATSILMPVDELSQIFKQNGIITVVDGAHGVGCTDLDLSNPDFDFYTSNNHKWMFAPKGSAFLYVSDKFVNEIHPPVISLFYGGGLRSEFEWQGTKDLSAWIATGNAIDFYHSNGGKETFEYNKQLLKDAKKLILSNVDTYSISDDMNTVLSTFFLSDKIEITHDTTMQFRKFFYEKYKIEIPFMIFDNKLFFRITCQIFNELNDYDILCNAIKDFKESGMVVGG